MFCWSRQWIKARCWVSNCCFHPSLWSVDWQVPPHSQQWSWDAVNLSLDPANPNARHRVGSGDVEDPPTPPPCLSMLKMACLIRVLVYVSEWDVESEYDCMKTWMLLKFTWAHWQQHTQQSHLNGPTNCGLCSSCSPTETLRVSVMCCQRKRMEEKARDD